MTAEPRETSSRQYTPLLVTGEMRSGTTLVANLLNSQKDSVVYADLLRSLFLEAEGLGVKDLSLPLSERARNVLCSSVAAEGWRVGLEALSEISRDQVKSWVDLYRRSLQSLDGSGLRKVIGTKITREYRYAGQLLDHGVRIIFCIRDPRDALLSAKNRFSRYSLFEYADWWKKSMMIGRSLAGHPNCKLVLFERLLSEQTRPVVLQDLSELLGIELTDDLTELSLGQGTRFVSNSSFGDVSKLFDTQAGWRWKSHLEKEEVVFASRFFREEIEQLGLERHDPDVKQYRPLRRKYFAHRIQTMVKNGLLDTYRRLFTPPYRGG